jgi:hypothetical protein
MQLLLLTLLIFTNNAYSNVCQDVNLYGEIESKERIGKEIKIYRKFIPIPKVMNHDSSSFRRISIRGKVFDKAKITYLSKNKKKNIQLFYNINDSILEKFDLYKFEERIEKHRPGILTIDFYENKNYICLKSIEFIGASK